MLASPVEEKHLSNLEYPVICSPKIDGVRVLALNGVLYSRSMKPIRNKALIEKFSNSKYKNINFDGEITVVDKNDPNVYRITTSYVNSFDKEEDESHKFVINVFDILNIDSLDTPYIDRLKSIPDFDEPLFSKLEYKLCNNSKEVLEYEQYCLNAGYEGIMVRSYNGKYKLGRSTLKEGIILKLKRFSDYEAIIVGFVEEYKNLNEAKKNELGRTERSSAKDGLVPNGRLGALICKFNDIEFNIGSGFTHEERTEVWDNRESYIGKLVKFKCFEVGVKDAPRFPIFLGFRSPDDL
jgi:DNA ligase-1